MQRQARHSGTGTLASYRHGGDVLFTPATTGSISHAILKAGNRDFPCIWEYQNAHYCASFIGTIRVIMALHLSKFFFALVLFIEFRMTNIAVIAYLTAPSFPIASISLSLFFFIG